MLEKGKLELIDVIIRRSKNKNTAHKKRNRLEKVLDKYVVDVLEVDTLKKSKNKK